MIYFIILLCTSLFFSTVPENMGYSIMSPLYTHFTYMFAHANIVHLVVNMFVLYRMRHKVSVSLLCLGVGVATALSFLPFNYLGTTVGFSGVLFFLLGYITFERLTTKYRLINIVMVAVASVVGLWSGAFNTWLHISAFVAGVSCLYLKYIWAEIMIRNK